ncbi:MAG TPA: hypothetical protein VIQ30_11935 [Pseudonocardia sp.]
MTAEGVEVELSSDTRVDPRVLLRVRDLLLERCVGDPPGLSGGEVDDCAGASVLVLSLLTDVLADLDRQQRPLPKSYDDADRVRDEHLTEAVGHLREAVGRASSWYGALRRGRSA